MAAVADFEQNVPLSLGNTAKEAYALAKQKGLDELDFSTIYRFLSENGH